MRYHQIVLVLVLACGCTRAPVSSGACTTDEECPPGQLCGPLDYCVSIFVDVDAGGGDAAAFDPADADRARPDAGPLDGALLDAGLPDGSRADGGSTDAAALDGALVDSGPLHSGLCGNIGTMGGPCRGGTTCATGLLCADDLSTRVGSTPSTLGGLWGIPDGFEDPAHPGEYLPTGPSSVPLRFAPGGQCSRSCVQPTAAAPDDGCGACATCTGSIGPDSIAALGIGVRTLTDVISSTAPGGTGLCRLDCAYDPATNGGCPAGYTCDPGENICLEACVSDAQCNVSFGLGLDSAPFGVIAYQREGAPYTCSATTGRCEHTPPAGAALDSECESNHDCPDPGVCLLGGRCGTLQCADSAGAPIPGACDGVCLGFGGNNGSLCLPSCATPDDCSPGQACQPSPVGGYCFAGCVADAQCRSTERCHEIRSASASSGSLSVCEAICDPYPADGTLVPGAVPCAVNEVCEAQSGEAYGHCAVLDQLCFDDASCNGGQTCSVEPGDFLGRCTDG